MAKTVYSTRLHELNQITPTMRELKVQIEGGLKMRFKAGQFVMLQVPQEGQPKPVQRAYSIASSDEFDDRFTLLFKHVPGGVASEYIAQLKGGESLDFTGPWGKCVFKHPPPPQVFFICTGSGLSQHMSFLLSDVQRYPETKFHMLVGMSTENEMFYHRKLQLLREKMKNFDYEWCLTKPSVEWSGRKGRVTTFIHEYDYKHAHIYLCGSGAMIKDMKTILVEENGVPKEHLIIENFG